MKKKIFSSKSIYTAIITTAAVALTLSAALIFALVHISASTPTAFSGGITSSDDAILQANGEAGLFLADITTTPSPAEEALYTGLKNSDTSINLESFSLTKDEVSQIFERVLYSHPDLFYVSRSYSYTYTPNETVLSLTPKYLYKGAALTAAKNEYSSLVADIASGVKSSWSNIEKLIYLNDYFCLNFSYDSTYTKGDAYTLLKEKTGVCQAYSLAFGAVLDYLGIKNGYVSSKSMNHAWNVVYIDGAWYHLDVTWNDASDVEGKAGHSNFLLSDVGISSPSASNHNGWTPDYNCTSTKYDTAIWRTVNTPFVYANGAWYAVDSSDFTVYKYNLNVGTRTALTTISGKWSIWDDNGAYISCYSGIGIYNGTLYYNNTSKIFAYDLATGNSRVLAEVDNTDGYMYYLTITGNKLTYYLRTSEKSAITAMRTIDLDAASEKYTVTYIVDNTVYYIGYYVPGVMIAPPQPPMKEGYVFTGWSPAPPNVMPEENLTVFAIFDVCNHKNTTEIVVKEATCTKDGTSRVVCSDCGKVVSELTVKAGHKPGTWQVTKAATCVSDGLRERLCSVCGKSLESEVVPATGIHIFGPWEIIKEPTGDSDGLRRRTCITCGEVEEETFSSPVSPDTETEPDSNDASTEPVTETGILDTETVTDTGSVIDDGRKNYISNQVALYILIVIISGAISYFLIMLIIKNDKNNNTKTKVKNKIKKRRKNLNK